MEVKEKDYQLSSLVIDACDVFDEQAEYYDEHDDAVHEIADGAIPIYYWDIAQYAAHNHWLMTEVPEINSEGTAHDQIQANIYQYVVEGLYEHIEERREKIDRKNKQIINKEK